jgi:precorrin-8X/cobalt-precorrin-8 methylmutase
MLDYIRDPNEISRRSFEIIEAEANLASRPKDIRPIAARIVHACGMPDVVADLAHSEGAGAVGISALWNGAQILCDVRMVAAGLMTKRLTAKNPVSVAIDEPDAEDLARISGQTRSAAGIELAAKRLKDSIVVIGNAPTALFRLLELIAEGAEKPALVLGFPVGFVGAAESKEALAANHLDLAFITLRGRRGGSAMAAAALNALILGSTA